MSAALQYALALPLEPSYAEEDFIVTDANREAHALVVLAPSAVMALSGPEGSGKTHLAHIFASKRDTRFVAPEELGRVTADRILGSASAVVVEQVERVREEEALAQLINEVNAKGRSMLLTSRMKLSKLETKRKDLASRLRAAHEVLIDAPDDALMAALLLKGFSDRQIRVEDGVIAYLLKRMERSATAVQRVIGQLDGRAMAKRQAITVPFVRDSLGALGLE